MPSAPGSKKEKSETLASSASWRLKPLCLLCLFAAGIPLIWIAGLSTRSRFIGVVPGVTFSKPGTSNIQHSTPNIQFPSPRPETPLSTEASGRVAQICRAGFRACRLRSFPTSRTKADGLTRNPGTGKSPEPADRNVCPTSEAEIDLGNTPLGEGGRPETRNACVWEAIEPERGETNVPPHGLTLVRKSVILESRNQKAMA